MTKFSLERGTYKSAGEVAATVFIRAAMTITFALFLVWLRFVFDFQVAVLFGLSVIIVALWSLEAK